MKKLILVLSFVLCGLFLIPGLGLAEVKVFFSPNGGCTEELEWQINNAKESIDIAMYAFTSKPLAEALVRALEREVEIQIIVDRLQARGRWSQVNYLLLNSIPVREYIGSVMHNKIMIVDNEILTTGSFNWSLNAEKNNQENMVVFINECKVISIYNKYLVDLWEKSRKIRDYDVRSKGD